MFSRKPQLSQDEKRAIVGATSEKLRALVGEFYETSTGIVLKSWLKGQLEQQVAAATEILTMEQLAQEKDTSVQAIRACLPQYASPIYGPQVLEAIAKSVPREPVSVVDFCRKHSITVQLLKQLDGVSIVGEHVVQTESLHDLQAEIDSLLHSKEPVTLPANVLTDHVVASTTLDGRYDRSTRVFTPRAYHQQQRQDLYERLLASGTLSSQELKPFDLDKFAKRFGLKTTKGRAYSPEYIASETQKIKDTVEREGYFDASGMKIKPLIELKYSEPVPGIFYKSSPALKAKLQDWAKQQGQRAAEPVKASATDSSRKLAHSLATPSTADIAGQIEIDEPRLVSYLTERHAVATREAFIAAATLVFEDKIREAALIVTARITAYLRGTELCEGALQDQLFEDWVAYAVENDPSAAKIQTIEQARAQFNVDTHAATAAILASNKAKLSKAKDPALLLHLAVSVKFSQMNPEAALRFRGKHMAKVLKQFEFPACFTELKNCVATKSDPKAAMEAVKASV